LSARGRHRLATDDSQLRYVLDDPFGPRIQSRHAPARVRVLEVAKAIPNQPPT
jgi:hypothetical protein